MTKTIEEVKAAKRELELKISQMVNEFALDHHGKMSISLMNINGIGQPTYYVCEIEIKL